MANSIDAALLEAGDPATSPERLRQLSEWKQPEECKRLRQVIAANPNVDDKLLWEFASDFPKEVVDNPRFQLLQLSGEAWWTCCSSPSLLQLVAVIGENLPDDARNHLAKLIWAELADSPISINLEAHQNDVADIVCELPSTRDGLVDLLSFLGVFEKPEGASVSINNWSDSTLGKAHIANKTVDSRSGRIDYSIVLQSSVASFTAQISKEEGHYRCEELDLHPSDTSWWDPEDYETPEERAALMQEILQDLFEEVEKPRFTVSMTCIVEENLANLSSTGYAEPLGAAELLSVIKSLGIEDGATIDLSKISYFDYELDYTPGGQGYWGICAVTPNPQGWSFDVSLDGFGAGSITATGPSGYTYEIEVDEPGQNQEFKNATLCESLAERLCDGHFSESEISRLLAKAFE